MWMCHTGLTPGNEGYCCCCPIRAALSNQLRILVARSSNGQNSMRMAIHHGLFANDLHVRQKLPNKVLFSRYSDVVKGSFNTHFYLCLLN